MKSVLVKVFLMGLMGVIALSACAGDSPEQPDPSETVVVTQATEQDVSETPEIAETEVTVEAATEAATETTTAEAPVETEESPVEIVHETQPDSPVYSQTLPSECNTGYAYEMSDYKVKPPCDNWDINLLERAVSSDYDNFYHYIDILSARAGLSDSWYYLGMDLFGAGVPEDESVFTYYFELDPDQDGRGEILITVQGLDLFATEWTVVGVRAYRDMNDDVGGETAVRPDDGAGNGYETLIFDEGFGSDPDLVWARRDPDHAQRIEFAFKDSVLEGETSFMWWGGAVLGEFDPAAFDFVDSQDSAAFFAMDTTCGWVWGHESGTNLRRCYIAPIPTAGPGNSASPETTPEVGCVQPPRPSADPCWIWIEEDCEWVCFN